MISRLAARYGIGDRGAARLEALVDFVASEEDAPTSVRDRAGILRDHLADSLVALDLPVVREAAVMADLGSGAGFPGLPLAIAMPESSVHLVESNGRKCAFIDRAAAFSGADNGHVVHGRAEEWIEGIGGCDVVVARALAPMGVVAEYAAPLLRLGGTLVAWRGQRDPEDERAAAAAAAALGLEPAEPLRVEPYPGALHRHLHLMAKVAQTPDRFPRRAGMARKRPLT